MEYVLSDIKSDYDSFEKLICFYKETKHLCFNDLNVIIDGWFDANLCSVLSGILDSVSKLNNVFVKVLNKNTQSILIRNGFLANYGYGYCNDSKNTVIKYLKLPITDNRYFCLHIMNELILSKSFLAMDDVVARNIHQSLCEIFLNAAMHSGTDFVYSCGQFYPKNNQIQFTIVDTGQGIRNSINNRFGSNLDSVKSIKWATKDGHTTKQDVSGGLGLTVLLEFIKENNGKLQIISDDGYYEYFKEERTKIIPNKFCGTIVNMMFIT